MLSITTTKNYTIKEKLFQTVSDYLYSNKHYEFANILKYDCWKNETKALKLWLGAYIGLIYLWFEIIIFNNPHPKGWFYDRYNFYITILFINVIIYW